MHKRRHTSKSQCRARQRRSLRRVLNAAGDFFAGHVNTKRLIRSRYGEGISNGAVRDSWVED